MGRSGRHSGWVQPRLRGRRGAWGGNRKLAHTLARRVDKMRPGGHGAPEGAFRCQEQFHELLNPASSRAAGRSKSYQAALAVQSQQDPPSWSSGPAAR